MQGIESEHRIANLACDDAASLRLQSHSCVTKACMITGIAHCRLLPTTAEEEWALNPDVVSAAVEEDLAAGLIPFFLCATVGTTSSCAVDPLRQLGEISQRHGLW